MIDKNTQVHHDRQKSHENSSLMSFGASIITLSRTPSLLMSIMPKAAVTAMANRINAKRANEARIEAAGAISLKD